jgi:hypothetical protein
MYMTGKISAGIRRSPMQTRDRARKVQTTLRLPRPLYERAKASIQGGHTEARTINDFVIAAVELYTKLLDRKRIDAAFRHMSEDADYQKEAQLVAEEFTHSDWEALQIAAGAEEETNVAR